MDFGNKFLPVAIIMVGIIISVRNAYAGLVGKKTFIYFGLKRLWFEGRNAQLVGFCYVVWIFLMLYFLSYYL